MARTDWDSRSIMPPPIASKGPDIHMDMIGMLATCASSCSKIMPRQYHTLAGVYSTWVAALFPVISYNPYNPMPGRSPYVKASTHACNGQVRGMKKCYLDGVMELMRLYMKMYVRYTYSRAGGIMQHHDEPTWGHIPCNKKTATIILYSARVRLVWLLSLSSCPPPKLLSPHRPLKTLNGAQRKVNYMHCEGRTETKL